MTLRSILAALRSVPPFPRVRTVGRRAKFRPRLEPLDDRCLPSFSPAASFTVGTNPHAVVAADFNNDDHLDLVTANSAGIVSVLLGDGGGGFGPTIDSAGGDNPISIAVGDFDADGNLDLAAVAVNGYDYGSYVSVMLGNGNGSFQAPSTVNLDPGSKPTSVATGDFNEDGLMDLAVTSNVDPYYPGDLYLDYGQASVLLSIGDGAFSDPRSTTLFNTTNSVVVRDFNGDGNLDLVVGTYYTGEIVRVILGDGQGNIAFANESNWSFRHGTSMDAGDVDGDGHTDLVAANGFDVSVRMGNGVGGFVAPPGGQSYAAGIGPISVVLGDFNRDGVLDIATANYGSNDVSLLRGKGGGTFWNPENFAAGPMLFAVAAGDFNGDGWLDVATANVSGNTASVLINDQSWGAVPPLVSVSDASVTEGNTGAVNATFTLTLLYATNVDVTVHYQTADISAAAGSDYAASSGDVIIPAGQTSGIFAVAVKGDRLAEPTETFAVNLTAATNATIGDGRGIGTILDNEPRIRIGDVTKREGNGRKSTLFTFTVTLSAAYDQSVTMSYQTVNGTATTGDSDYIAKIDTLTFAPGETTKTITIEVKSDNRREANETFYLDLYGPSSNGLFTKNRGIGTIWNDD